MSILVALNHKTEYQFDRSVNLSPHVIRLRPAPHCRTPIRSYSLKIEPAEHFINWQQDAFGNYLARIVFPEKTRKLSVEVDVIAEMLTINPFDFFLEEYAFYYPFEYDADLKKELAPYLEVTEDGPLLKEWLKGVDLTRRETVYFLVDLNQRLQADIGYVIRMEPGVQTCEQTLGTRQGLLPRHRLAAGADPAPSWSGRAFRLRLSGAVDGGREVARWPVRSRGGLHRPARLGRGLCAGRGLDRARPHLGSVRRRGPYPARLLARARAAPHPSRGHRQLRGRVLFP